MPFVTSVNVGSPRAAAWAAGGRTSMEKLPVAGPVRVGWSGFAGDGVANTKSHGGPDRAVYAYGIEDLDWWSADLGRQVLPGHFSENLTTSGLNLNQTEIGSQWRIGDAVLEVALTRTPCVNFKTWMDRTGFDAAAWVKRFTRAARPGALLRVLEPGSLKVGDEIEVIHKPGHAVTVHTMFVALHVDRTRLPDLLAVRGLADSIRARVDDYLAPDA